MRPMLRGVTRLETGTPNAHPDTGTVDPAATEGRKSVLPWEVSVPLGENRGAARRRAALGQRSQQRPY